MEQQLLSKISKEEYEILNYYRDRWGWSQNGTGARSILSIRSILEKSWAIHKQNLFKLFGNQLIIEKDFCYEKEADELMDEFEDMFNNHLTYGREGHQGYKFMSNYYSYCSNIKIPSCTFKHDRWEYDSEEESRLADEAYQLRDGLYELISYEALATNVYNSDDFSFELKNGKKYTVKKGCKVMKALSKVAETFDIEGFEEFRICHSLIHNQKKLKGKITLSIHPLDYWTMSDNQSGWESCMSWWDGGAYRLGTVEMMNSPSVIVAYISAETPMTFGHDYTWNNKKWRQLFIIDEEVILGIKSYPYFNTSISKEVAVWLKELAKENMNWDYFGEPDGKPIEFRPSSYIINPYYPNENAIRFDFYSENMYTDIGCTSFHPMYVGTHVHKTNSEINGIERPGEYNCPTEKCFYIKYNYSGKAQCMACGDTYVNFASEAEVICTDCQEHLRCSCCGCEVYPDEYMWFGDEIYCNECYNDNIASCIMCGEENFKEHMKEMFIGFPLTEETINSLKNENARFIPSKFSDEYQYFAVYRTPFYCCENDLDEFKENFLKPKANELYKTYKESDWSETMNLVDIKDINFDSIDSMNYYIPQKIIDLITNPQTSENYLNLLSYPYYFDIVLLKPIQKEQI